MDFIKPLVSKCWSVPEDKIFRDQDPSLTISEGVAEVARTDLRTQDLDKDLKPLLDKANGNTVYDKFVEVFGNYLYENIAESVYNKCIEWRDGGRDSSLNNLNWKIELGVKNTVKECSDHINEGLEIAFEEETKELRDKVDAIVAAYTAQGANIDIPPLPKIDVMNEGGGIDMSEMLKDISKSIETESSNWGGLIAGAGIGAAVAMILGGPLAWIIGGGALIGKWLFGQEESEADKKAKAMSKNLDSNERIAVCQTLSEKWDEILASINSSVYNSLRNNGKARREVSQTVDRMLHSYMGLLKNSRIMVD